MKFMKCWKVAMVLAMALPLGIPAGAQTINDRKENQQDRVAQGVNSGQLTAGETARLEHREASLNREERTMRRANGGTLTPADRAALNRRQNRLSRQIYRDKHNARRQ